MLNSTLRILILESNTKIFFPVVYEYYSVVEYPMTTPTKEQKVTFLAAEAQQHTINKSVDN
jgi:hypothetical protein